MARTGRPGLSPQQTQELWVRWKAGQSLSDIGRALSKAPGSIHGVLKAQGGIGMPTRCRSQLALTLDDREEISRGLAAGLSMRKIAHQLGRAPSTVCREIQRNQGLAHYRAGRAEERAWREGQRPKPCRLAVTPPLRILVAAKLQADWSPAQIAGWLARTYPEDPTMRVSHETIYRSLFIQARGVLKKALIAHLRSKRTMRRGKHATTAGQDRARIREAVSIRERPAAVADRAVPGHWEGDLLAGARNSHVATLVERHSRFVMLVRVEGKTTEQVVAALVRQVAQLPQGVMASLTWDRGMELAQHRAFTVATAVAVYFCDPKSPWQRGTNENTNGLLRQYFPKGMDLAPLSQADLDAIALQLNTRPRKTLGFRTPGEQFAQAVALTG